MKPTTYHHHILIPWDLENEAWRKFRTMFPHITPEEVMSCYFSNLAFMLDEGWEFSIDDGAIELEAFRKIHHMLVTLIGSDLEGMGEVPQEFDLQQVDIIHEFVKYLTWHLLAHLHPECWHHCQLNFIRVLRDAIVVAYHGERPFQVRSHNPFLPALLSDI